MKGYSLLRQYIECWFQCLCRIWVEATGYRFDGVNALTDASGQITLVDAFG